MCEITPCKSVRTITARETRPYMAKKWFAFPKGTPNERVKPTFTVLIRLKI